MNYSEILLRKAPQLAYGAEPLALLAYPLELRLKTEAIADLWKQERLPLDPGSVVASPLARAYRTTSKRRVHFGERGLALDFADRSQPGICAASVLEPDSHNALYAALFDKLMSPAFKPLASALNWIIIRGNYSQHAIIFNVAKLDATVVRKAKLLSEFLPTLKLGVTGAMLYFDPTRSDYYLEAQPPEEGLQSKHLFGPRLLTLAIEDLKLKYPLTGFSQINESIIPTLIQSAREMLELKPEDRLLDLYCGYGLFSFTLGRQARECLGIEMTGESIATAMESSMRMGTARKIRFKAGRITRESLPAMLPLKDAKPEVILLDPPRQGCEPGVIGILAARKPRRVLHICCGTDEVAPAMREWKAAGYALEQCRALDLFPGTPNLETLLSFVPA